MGDSVYHIDERIQEAGQDPWRLTFVYGEAQTHLRIQTWDLLKGLSFLNDLPWLCMGDFNEVLCPEEHQGAANRSNAQIQAFRDTVDICMLMDLGYQGRFWTFEKKVHGGHYCRVRLDRALASPEWSAMFPYATLRHLQAAKSDHSPIVLCNNLDSVNKGIEINKPFRYERMWETREDFPPLDRSFVVEWER